MRKKALKRGVFTAAAVTVVVMIAAICAASEKEIRAESARDVSEFLSGCGLTAVYVSEKEITVPTDFSEVYERYNELQKEQGFDLSRHKGHCAVSYTFRVKDYTDENGEPVSGVEAHVLVCEGRIVGGDIADTRLGGFMKALR